MRIRTLSQSWGIYSPEVISVNINIYIYIINVQCDMLCLKLRRKFHEKLKKLNCIKRTSCPGQQLCLLPRRKYYFHMFKYQRQELDTCESIYLYFKHLADVSGFRWHKNLTMSRRCRLSSCSRAVRWRRAEAKSCPASQQTEWICQTIQEVKRLKSTSSLFRWCRSREWEKYAWARVQVWSTSPPAPSFETIALWLGASL